MFDGDAVAEPFVDQLASGTRLELQAMAEPQR
jgi:hypothetical protein